MNQAINKLKSLVGEMQQDSSRSNVVSITKAKNDLEQKHESFNQFDQLAIALHEIKALPDFVWVQ